MARLKMISSTLSKPRAGLLAEAVEELDHLVQGGSAVEQSVINDILKRCIAHKDAAAGSRVHALAVNCGYGSDEFVASTIIRMYASHGNLAAATNVFHKFSAPTLHMWSSIILAHARHGKAAEALELYRMMRKSPLKPNNHIFVAALKACSTAKDLVAGSEIHADIMLSEDLQNVFVGNSLVDMYAKCGCLTDARRVFDNLPVKDVVTWNSMIGGYSQQGLGQAAISLYESMQQEVTTPPNRVTFVCLSQACAGLGDLDRGKVIHADLQRRALEGDTYLSNSLVDMYGKCKSIEDARKVFESVAVKDVVTYNAMIAGYVQNGLNLDALALYASMQQQDTIRPNQVTYTCIMRTCANVGCSQQAKQIEERIYAEGLPFDLVTGNCLVDTYVKCGSVEDARRVFETLTLRDVVTWTTMIGGYAQHGLGHEALALYEKMQQESKILANEVTFVCLLQACASTEALAQGKQLHRQIADRGMETNVNVATCIIDMYMKCRSVDIAREVFDSLLLKNVVTWNVMIAGYANNGDRQAALTFFESMREEGLTPGDPVTFLWLLDCCGKATGLSKGRQLHALISEMQLERTDPVLANALVSMYCRCGSMVDAEQVFNSLPQKDIVTWNTLMQGHARQGDSKSVFDLFQKMRQGGLLPDEITFLSLLTACSHAGLEDEGQQYFEAMITDYGVTPTMEHCNCLIDLHARAGQVSKAFDMLKTFPFRPRRDMVRTVLSACQKWSNVEVGQQVFEWAWKFVRLDATIYMLMANIYSAGGLQKEAEKILALRVQERAWKKPGKSWCTDGTDETMHTFMAENRTQEPADRFKI